MHLWKVVVLSLEILYGLVKLLLDFEVAFNVIFTIELEKINKIYHQCTENTLNCIIIGMSFFVDSGTVVSLIVS